MLRDSYSACVTLSPNVAVEIKPEVTLSLHCIKRAPTTAKMPEENHIYRQQKGLLSIGFFLFSNPDQLPNNNGFCLEAP